MIQHATDPDSFVYTVPFDSGSSNNITVTASHAIFPRDAGLEAPGSVVGFQFDHSNFYYRFMNITNTKDVSIYLKRLYKYELQEKLDKQKKITKQLQHFACNSV